MIDTDKYEGHQPANLWGREIVAEEKRKIFLNTAWLSSIGNDVYSNEKDRLLMADAPLLLAEVKQLREQYMELREALVGDSPNWTHEELIEKVLEVIDKACAWDMMVEAHTSDSENDWVITELMDSILKEVKQ